MMKERGTVGAGPLTRLLRPGSVAIVGASEKQERSRNVVRNLLDAQVDVYLVNPHRATAFGLAAYPSLAAVGKSVDAVFISVNAGAAIEPVAQAAALGAGGVVVNAGGFGEAGPAGQILQQRLLQAAQRMPLLGPNCNGYIDQVRNIRLSGAPSLPIRAGSVGFVTHSGALIGSFGAACHVRGIGLSHLVSTGNEANLDMVDLIDFMAEDPATRVICLAVESIRRPRAFLAAVGKAHAAGKPVLALKLGRSRQGKAIAQSHTGALSGDAWTYDTVFQQFGIEIAHDLNELAARAVCFAQLPCERWSPLQGLAIITASGGGAGLASDLCEPMGIDLPALNTIVPAVRDIVPGAQVVNPLDMTGFTVGNADASRRLLKTYLECEQVDTLLLQWFIDDAGTGHGAAFLEPFAQLAADAGKTMMLGSLEDGPIGEWAARLPSQGAAVGRGLPDTLRALESMGRFTRHQCRGVSEPLPASEPLPPPVASDRVHSGAGSMLGFRATMDLLKHVGLEVAPYVLIAPGEDVQAAIGELQGPCVVKLADVPHRTELGAVRVNVARADLRTTVDRMRALAMHSNLPATVAIQAQVPAKGEVFIGINGESGFGPIVLCGAGGVLIEVLGGAQGALAPLGPHDVESILARLRRNPLFSGHRGSTPIDESAFVKVLAAANRLALGTREWLRSADVNPLIFTGESFVAVDGLFLCR